MIRISPQTLPARLHNVPSEPTSLLGRDGEIAAVARLLRRADLRLLVVTGPGGVGKTRLAIRVGEVMCRDFENGAWFVSLSAIANPGLVASAIAQALGIKEAAGLSPLENLKEHLREQHALLILDNFEQLLEAAAPEGSHYQPRSPPIAWRT